MFSLGKKIKVIASVKCLYEYLIVGRTSAEDEIKEMTKRYEDGYGDVDDLETLSNTISEDNWSEDDRYDDDKYYRSRGKECILCGYDFNKRYNAGGFCICAECAETEDIDVVLTKKLGLKVLKAITKKEEELDELKKESIFNFLIINNFKTSVSDVNTMIKKLSVNDDIIELTEELDMIKELIGDVSTLCEICI